MPLAPDSLTMGRRPWVATPYVWHGFSSIRNSLELPPGSHWQPFPSLPTGDGRTTSQRQVFGSKYAFLYGKTLGLSASDTPPTFPLPMLETGSPGTVRLSPQTMCVKIQNSLALTHRATCVSYICSPLWEQLSGELSRCAQESQWGTRTYNPLDPEPSFL